MPPGQLRNLRSTVALLVALAALSSTASAQPLAPPTDATAPPSAAPVAAPAATPAVVAQGQTPPSEPTAAPAKPLPPGPTQLKLEIANGTSIRFGLLWQGQYEARGSSANDDLTHNLFLRRFALLIGGTVLDKFEYFFDSDFADLLKAPTGEQSLKNGPGFAAKDAFVTYRALDDRLKLDAGLLLPPGSHNSLQGGGTIYAWDFFLNTFRHSTVFGSTANPYGRDAGAQVRGIVGPLEYRVGVFQGRRLPPVTAQPTRPAARNSFRLAARVQLNLLDAETGYFYGGTYLGKKKILSIGASADVQHSEEGSYRTLAGDLFVDVPAGPGLFTAQVNVVHRNGGAVVALPKQTAFMAEAGYLFDAIKLSPIGRFERRWGEGAAGDETDVGGGLAFWPYGHTSNLKAFYTRLIPGGPVAAYDQLNVQWQVFFY
jgi:hypothetical protein